MWRPTATGCSTTRATTGGGRSRNKTASSGDRARSSSPTSSASRPCSTPPACSRSSASACSRRALRRRGRRRALSRARPGPELHGGHVRPRLRRARPRDCPRQRRSGAPRRRDARGDHHLRRASTSSRAPTQTPSALGFVSRFAAARQAPPRGHGHRRRRLRGRGAGRGRRASTSSSDPACETLGRGADAVLAAVEAVRHVALPFLADRETRRYEAQRGAQGGRGGRGGHALGPLSPSAAAREVRARRGWRRATPRSGPARPRPTSQVRRPADAERSWQAGRLVELLSVAG